MYIYAYVYIDNIYIFMYILKGEIAFKALIMFITCVYSYLIRNVHSHVAGSRVIVLIAYNMAFISIVIILVVELTAVINVPLSVLIKAIGISYVVISIAGKDIYIYTYVSVYTFLRVCLWLCNCCCYDDDNDDVS
jgi:hypothetical protein